MIVYLSLSVRLGEHVGEDKHDFSREDGVAEHESFHFKVPEVSRRSLTGLCNSCHG